MAINKATLARMVDNTIEYVYPKSSADLIDYDATQTVAQKIASIDTSITTMDARITNIASSTVSGDVATDATEELVDIRLGADGTTYASAGEAVRQQLTQLSNDSQNALNNGLLGVNNSIILLNDDYTILKEDLDEFKTNIRMDYYDSVTAPKDITIVSERNSGYIDPSGVVHSSESYVYTQKIQVSEGDVITGRGRDTNYNVETALAMQRICAYNDGTAVSESGVSSYVMTYTVPSGIDEIIISYLSTMVDVNIYHHIEVYTDYIPKIDAVNESMSHLISAENKTTVEEVTPSVVSGKFVNKSGSISNSSSYYYFNIENLEKNDVVAVRSFYNTSNSIVVPYFRYVCCYDANGVAQADKGGENVFGQFAIPEGITKIAISIASTYPIAGNALIYRDLTVDNILVNNNINSCLFASNPQSVNSSLNPSSTLSMVTNAVKKNKEILFNANISTFNKITIGQGANDLNSARYEIDGTNITYYRGTADTGIVHQHGLTFADYISVIISVNNEHIPTIRIMTNSGMFTVAENVTWVGCMPNVYATTDTSTTLSECTLTLACKDISKPLWIFGDSYVSYAADRWTYYVSQMEYNGYLLNGYSGEDSPHAVQDLRNLLQFGTPKYIVWALGMNDADTAEAVNNNWMAVYNELKALCNQCNINLILCTIPNVPTRSHVYKNNIIINSGYKYINFASAVGALDGSTWYTGTLSNDGVHPTIEGGKALASAVLKDYPYICIN